MLLLNDYIDIDRIRVTMRHNEEVEGLGSGQIIRSELTEPLWEVEIFTTISEFNTGRQIRAVLNRIDKPGVSFRVYDPIARYPANDPVGARLTGAPVEIRVATPGPTISLQGIPTGSPFMFLPGDAFTVDYGGRRYYAEIAEPVSINAATGNTSAVAITPSLPAGIPIGTPVNFVQPEMRVQVVPDALEYAFAESATWKMGAFQIRAVQKL